MPFKDHAEYLRYQREYSDENSAEAAVRMAKHRQGIRRAEMWWTQKLTYGKAAPQLLEGLSQTVLDEGEKRARKKLEMEE